MLPMAVNILVGILLLTMGRALFWFFVGAAGFVFANSLARQFLIGQPEWVILAVSVAAGLVGIVVAILAQKLAIGLAGFAMGGYAVVSLLYYFGYSGNNWAMIGFLAGGIAGALLAFLLLNPALIILSCIAGAMLISQSVPLSQPLNAALFIALLVVGVIIQTAQLRRKQAVE